MSAHSPLNPKRWKIVLLASLGGALELYDFIIYGIFAIQIASQFFPTDDPVVALLSTFGVFAIGYVSRPLGGILLSSLGDRYGRRVVFMASIFGMSLSTLAIGLVPNYAAIGIWAPLLLIVFRTCQGFFLAGELPCSITYVVEEIPERATLVSGLVIFCLISGVLVGTLVSFLLHSFLTAEQVSSFGWRLAFILGGCLGLASYFVRKALSESSEFKKIKGSVIKRPFRTVLKEHRREVVMGIFLAGITNATNVLLFVVLPSYMTGMLHLDGAKVSAAQNMGVAVLALSLLLCAYIGDRSHPHKLHRLGCIIVLVGAYPFYWALTQQVFGPLEAYLIAGLVGGLFNGTYAALLAKLFPTQVRFSGIGLSLNLATVLFTGAAPLIITQLIKSTGHLTAPAYFLITVAAMALIAGFSYGRQQKAPDVAVSQLPS